MAEVCRFYGWTVEYVLKMPAQTFLLMRESAKKIRAQELADLCTPARMPAVSHEAYIRAIEHYRQGVDEPIEIKRPEPKADPVQWKESARAALMHAFYQDKRIH